MVASFAFHDPTADTMTYLAMGTPDRPAHRLTSTVPAENTLAQRVMWSMQSAIVDDYRTSSIPLHAERVKDGFLSSAAIPILRENDVLNVVGDRARAFSQEHVAQLEELAPHLVVAIEKARLFEQVTMRARRSSRLAELSRLVSESLDAEREQQFVVQAAADLLGADLTRLYLVDSRAGVLHLAASTVSADVASGIDTWAPALQLALHGTLMGHVVTTGRPRYSRDIQTDPLTAHKAEAQSLGFHSQLAAPLLAGTLAIGVLSVGYRTIREQRDFAETIRSSAESLLTIVNDILDFSKIEAGRLELEVVDCNTRQLVEDVADLLAESAHRKGLELVTLLEPEVPAMVRGDPGRLRQVLTNLVANAIKFTERGEVVVRVSSSEGRGESDDGSSSPLASRPSPLIRFEVHDTGIGIPAEVGSRLFQAFAQADGSTTRRYGGTGLGLTISRQLVELMGGQIGLESEVGRGSTFWFVVQLERSFAVPEPVRGLRAERDGVRVLIVDDNQTNRTILGASCLTRECHCGGRC